MTARILLVVGLGVIGVLGNNRHVIRTVIWVEGRLLVRNRTIRISASKVDDRLGLVLSRRVRTVAAAEATIGLGLRLAYYRVYGSVGLHGRNRVQT